MIIDKLITLKNSLLGILSVAWGSIILFSNATTVEPTLELIGVSSDPIAVGIVFIVVGIGFIISRITLHPGYVAIANVCQAAVLVTVMLSHLYISLFAISWVALLVMIIQLLINAYLVWRMM